MAEERVQRRLAAILAADVAGYSRLMGEDEEGTLATLTSHLTDLIEPCIAEHRGRVVKTTGDGLLAEFASVVDAVRCAVAFQEGMRERNADTPKNRRIEFRIGINLGDVIVQDDDVYGDGVNVAARLEGLAEPGAVVVSGTVHEHVRSKLDIGFNDLGSQEFKNIAEPVRAYGVATALSPTKIFGAPLPLPDKPSIAVLPFQNMSGDPEQEYFSDGITEDIITALSRIRQFFVIARNTTFTYKGQAVDVQAVAREMGVRYVLEGSVRKAASRVRISAQLIDGATGNHIWAEKFDRELEDIFAVQDEITSTVVGSIGHELSRAEQERALRTSSESLDTWTLFQRGLWHFWRYTKEDLANARDLFEQVTEADPNFAPAFAHRAFAVVQAITQGFSATPHVDLDAARSLAQNAVLADDQDALTHCALGAVHLWRHEPSNAVQALERAVDLNPNFAQAHLFLSSALAFDGRPTEAIPVSDAAMRLSPNDPMAFVMFAMRGAIHLNLKEFEQARAWAERARQRSKAANVAPIVLMTSLGHLGLADKAREVLNEFLERNPPLSEDVLLQRVPFGRQEDIELWFEGLRRAGVLT